jgi:hypothetical protein
LAPLPARLFTAATWMPTSSTLDPYIGGIGQPTPVVIGSDLYIEVCAAAPFEHSVADVMRVSAQLIDPRLTDRPVLVHHFIQAAARRTNGYS